MAQKLISDARLNFGKFENSTNNEQKDKFLDNALSDLLEVIEGDFPEEKKKIAKNMIYSFRNYIFNKIDELIKGPDFIDEDMACEWVPFFNKFEEFGFGNDDEYKNKNAKIIDKISKVIMAGRTIDERRRFAKLLEIAAKAKK